MDVAIFLKYRTLHYLLTFHLLILKKICFIIFSGFFPERLDKISYFVQRFPPIAGQVKTREEYYSYICMYVCRVQLGSFLGSPQRLLRSTTNVAAASRVVERRKIDTVGVFCVVLFSSLMQTRGLPHCTVF